MSFTHDGGTERRLPTIGARLYWLVICSVGLSLLLFASLNIVGDVSRFAAGKRETMLATARVFAAAASRAVAVEDASAVMQTLRSVATIPGLLRAEVRTPQGQIVAELGESAYLTSDPTLGQGSEPSLLALIRSDALQVRVPIIQGGENVGDLMLLASLDGLPQIVVAVLARDILAAVSVLTLALILAWRLQVAITGPLQLLVASMKALGSSPDFAPVEVDAKDEETFILSASFNAMVKRIAAATQEILDREDEIIGRLSRAAEQRDDQTGKHVVRVAELSRLIASELRLPPDFVDDFVRASPMHDIGKVSVPDAILFKPGRLDENERQVMERHARAGHDILANSQSRLVQLAAEIALTHHERWDGKGYPSALAEIQIPITGRITAVADVCDALLSHRPYKTPWTLEAVREHLVENAGAHFDPDCVTALLARWEEVELLYQTLGQSGPSFPPVASV